MMDKTLKINISGILFQIDEEAFRILRDYLQAIDNRFSNVSGGHETIEDIELRIAEIFQPYKNQSGVISRENVEAMILIIGKPEDFDNNETEADAPIYTSQRKRMYRNPDDSIISGVCGGIGTYLNTDPVLLRILFVIFAVFFGVGFFVYIALWIALPSASTDSRKKEMYGNAYDTARSRNRYTDGGYTTNAPLYSSGYNNIRRVGNAINEVFRAIGRVFYIALRIVLIIIGVTLVLTGFLLILSFVMIFILHLPNAFTTHGFDMSLTYFPDFLKYIVSPQAAPWIMVLTSIAFILPILALIYWGVKMIFLFKAKDGVFSLAGFVLWVMTITALTIICFNEGISFAETAKSSSQIVLPHSTDTLYIQTANKVSDLKYDKELSLAEEKYNVFINEDKKEIYIRSYLKVFRSDDDITRVELRKRSSARSEIDALKKTGELLYNYRINSDTLLLDEYFTIPSGRKWSADNVGINLYIPEGTLIKFDIASEKLFNSHSENESEDDINSIRWESGHRTWILTDEGLKILSKPSHNQK